MTLWAFGIVFLAIVAIFCWWLFRSSNKNREQLARIPRKSRIGFGLVSCLISVGFAVLAIQSATLIKDWDNPSVIRLLAILICMLMFVGFQVVGMVSFLSLVLNSETEDDSMRP